MKTTLTILAALLFAPGAVIIAADAKAKPNAARTITSS
jgi:hypothetical protein